MKPFLSMSWLLAQFGNFFLNKHPKDHNGPFSCYLALEICWFFLLLFCWFSADRETNRSENITFYPCKVNLFKYLCLTYDVANKNAAFALLVGLEITGLTRLWWQLLQLSRHPSFYLLLVSVREHCKKTWGWFTGVGGRTWRSTKQHAKMIIRPLCVFIEAWACSHFFTCGVTAVQMKS